MESYSTRNYAGTYQGEPLTSIVSYKGLRTHVPLMVYQNSYIRDEGGVDRSYTTGRTSQMGWRGVNLKNFTKEYAGFVNYTSDDTASFAKLYQGAGSFAGVDAFQK